MYIYIQLYHHISPLLQQLPWEFALAQPQTGTTLSHGHMDTLEPKQMPAIMAIMALMAMG